jgi:hypothetical protein
MMLLVGRRHAALRLTDCEHCEPRHETDSLPLSDYGVDPPFTSVNMSVKWRTAEIRATLATIPFSLSTGPAFDPSP